MFTDQEWDQYIETIKQDVYYDYAKGDLWTQAKKAVSILTVAEVMRIVAGVMAMLKRGQNEKI